jgi:hypothetical protein
MARVLFCRRCTAGVTATKGDIPTLCPFCGYGAGWTTQMAPLPDEPRPAWELTHNDKRFLASIKVSSDL